MPKQYCPSCGSANDYSTSPPKFCNQCAKPMSISIATVQAPSVAISAPRRATRPVEDEEEDIYFEPPAKLSVEWEVEKPQRPSFASLLQGDQNKIQFDKPKRGKGKKANAQEAAQRAQRVSKWREFMGRTQRHDIGGSNED